MGVQDTITLALAGGAVLWIVRKLWSALNGRGRCGCGCAGQPGEKAADGSPGGPSRIVRRPIVPPDQVGTPYAQDPTGVGRST